VKLRAVIVMCAAAIVASFLLIGVAIWERKATLDNANHRVCVAIQNLNAAITASLNRSLDNLPKIQYFREHPEELARQRGEIERQLVVFRPRSCK